MPGTVLRTCGDPISREIMQNCIPYDHLIASVSNIADEPIWLDI
jgi:hypothetical protein